MAGTYTTKNGDTWDAIAYTQMGSCDYTDELIDANIHLCDIFLFSSGVELTIPDIPETENDNLPPWRR